MILNDILNEQRIYAMINDVPILRESEVHLFEELIGLYRPTSASTPLCVRGGHSHWLLRFVDGTITRRRGRAYYLH